MTREFPILFTGEMVRAILEGRKTQTRRLVALPEDVGEVIVDPGGSDLFGPGPYVKAYPRDHLLPMHPRIRCPYGYAGDHLWVRETWRSWTQTCRDDVDHDEFHSHDEHCKQTYVAYQATPRVGYRPVPDRARITYLEESTPLERNPQLLGPWKPGIHMFRWASRLSLEVVEIRVQRLQEITDEDAKAEGARHWPYIPDPHPHVQGGRWSFTTPTSTAQCLGTPRFAFANLWNRINGARRRRVELMVGDPDYILKRPWKTVIDTSARWEANPWVWAVTFRRLP